MGTTPATTASFSLSYQGEHYSINTVVLYVLLRWAMIETGVFHPDVRCMCVLLLYCIFLKLRGTCDVWRATRDTPGGGMHL